MENSRARSECCLCAMKMLLSDNVRAEAVNLVFMLWPRHRTLLYANEKWNAGKTTCSTAIYNCVCVNLPVRLAAWRVAAGRAPASPLCGGLSLWTRTFVAWVFYSSVSVAVCVTSRIPLATAKSRLSTAQIVMTNKWQISCASRSQQQQTAAAPNKLLI